MILIHYFSLEGVRHGMVQTEMSEPSHKMQSELLLGR